MSRLALPTLRAAPNATPGPSSVPARYFHGCWSVAPRTTPRVQPSPTRYRNVRLNHTASGPALAPIGVPHKGVAFEESSNGLSASQPCFGARGDEISSLSSPQEFYGTSLEMIGRAKRRIIISSSYIGAEESESVEALQAALKKRPYSRVTIISDYHRATRLSKSTDHPPSTAHLLSPLSEQYSDRCEVWLYRSPKLRGIMERIVPDRYDEGWGTWHGKWYGIDDEVIISGANLASSYFSNRQDRYIHFRSHPSLLSYLSSLTRSFTQYSYLLSPSPPPSISRHHLVPLPQPPGSSKFFGTASSVWPTPSIHPRAFSQHASATLSAFQKSWKASNASRMRRVDVDTYFWPVIQAGVLGIKEEEAALGKVWEAVRSAHATEDERVSVDSTSGYFGLYKAYKRAVIDSPAPFRVIAASPKANGFYGSAGLSRLIPEGYTFLERRFWQDAQSKDRSWQGADDRGVRLKEWEREGWTYHSKGIWVSPIKPQSAPFMTFIGSSNLSTRSLQLDTESSILLSTSSPSLRRALGAEVKALDKHAVDVGEETWKKEERQVSSLAKVLIALGIDGMS